MPAVEGDRVFVMIAERLLALHAQDGSLAWDFDADAPLTRGDDVDYGRSTASVASGQLVYMQAGERYADGTAHQVLLAITMRDGLAWQYDVAGVAATPANNTSGDTLCLGISAANTRRVVGLAAAAGRTRWSTTRLAFVSSCVAVGDAFLMAEGTPACATGSLLAANSQDGRQLWTATVGAPFDADGALAPTVVIGGSCGVRAWDDLRPLLPCHVMLLENSCWRIAVGE